MNEHKLLDLYLNKINAEINSFVKQINKEYEARLGDTFEVDMLTNIIFYPIFDDEEAVFAFTQNFTAQFPCAAAYGTFLLSLLHEIGHLETENESIDDIEEREKVITFEDYFSLWNEKIATEWAGNWLENHSDIANKFEVEVGKLFEEMYEKVLTD